eukprot:gnl/Carplike_NY0171/10179_a14319_135.p1 GENE.gnl/Carplike_NY0171/10179_a14319_135~~gnl/Carplike_NY0171/10179_a14319_135.p1  ORF type:complete len:188 (-),score=44.90 gnl/Carplike_NY0171/10179_a14319_135:34-561(-)
MGHNYFSFKEGVIVAQYALQQQFPNAVVFLGAQKDSPCSSLPSLFAGEICWQYKPGKWKIDCSLGFFLDKSTNKCSFHQNTYDQCVSCRDHGKQCIARKSGKITCVSVPLSTGAIVGIVLGSVVLVGCVVFFIIFFIKKKKNPIKEENSRPNEDYNLLGDPSEEEASKDDKMASK